MIATSQAIERLEYQRTFLPVESHRADPQHRIGLPAAIADRIDLDKPLTAREEFECSRTVWQSAAELRGTRTAVPMETEYAEDDWFQRAMLEIEE